MRIPVLPLLLAFLCLVPCSWSQALQNTPVVVSAITPAPSGDAVLYYNPNTGELIIATNGVVGIAITAQSDDAFDLSTVGATVNSNGNMTFEVDTFDSSVVQLSAETFNDNQLVVFGFDPNDPETVSLPTGVHILGPILAPGAFTPADFTAAFGDIRLDRVATGQPVIELSGVVQILDTGPIQTSIDVAINGDEIQRSIVRDIELTFPGDVQVGANAFSIVDRANNTISPTISVSTQLVGGSTVATLTFSGDGVEASGSLADGNYELAINGNLITVSQGIAFDADGDGTPGGQLVIGDQVEDGLFRYFGDADGDRDTDGLDAFPFINSLFLDSAEPGFNEIFDFDGDSDCLLYTSPSPRD